MLAGLSLDFPSLEFGCRFKKAFDSTDAFSALEILQLWGIPATITQLLENQWLGPLRYSSLPQGNPWSPISLAAILVAPLRKMEQEHLLVGHMLCLGRSDDLGSIAEVRAAQSSWDQFFNITGLETHPLSKHNFWILLGHMGWDAMMNKIQCVQFVDQMAAVRRAEVRMRTSRTIHRSHCAAKRFQRRATSMEAWLFGPGCPVGSRTRLNISLRHSASPHQQKRCILYPTWILPFSLTSSNMFQL